MHNRTLSELADDLRSRKYTSGELTQFYLDRIEQLNPSLNALISVNPDLAMERAKAADQKLKQGSCHPLTGIPIIHKDIFCTEGVLTTCGSKMLSNFVAPYESTVTQRCLNAGMVPLGKANMDEFAMGSSNEQSYFGPCKNPWDVSRVPGGSSGGSAAAVAAQLAPVATGTDTGGSIRQPAGFCGITGLKPTYGRVSRWGMIAYASSLDQAGPMARSCKEAALLLQTMAGFDEKDSTSVDKAVPDFSQRLNEPLAGTRIGVPTSLFEQLKDEGVAKALQTALRDFETLGAQLTDITLPHLDAAASAYYVIASAECSSNLSRFDGVRYGHRCDAPSSLEDLYERSRSEGFGSEVKRRIMMGTYALSAGYYDAYYLKAQKVRRLVQQSFFNAFGNVDLIVSPTSPSTPFSLGEKPDPISLYLEDIFTIPVNLAGLPAVTLPAGFEQQLPVGIQLIGRPFEEDRLLQFGHHYQQQNPWHLETCALSQP